MKQNLELENLCAYVERAKVGVPPNDTTGGSEETTRAFEGLTSRRKKEKTELNTSHKDVTRRKFTSSNFKSAQKIVLAYTRPNVQEC